MPRPAHDVDNPDQRSAGDAPPAPDLRAVSRLPETAIVQRVLQGDCRVQPADHVLLGLSAGADSAALLLLLAVLRDRGVFATLSAVHVHHHLRDAADDDAVAAFSMCSALGISFFVAHIHPGKERGNTEAAARRLRYAALARAATEHVTQHVAVAHHADDQFETMLMALARGSGLRGLGGMPVRRRLTSPIPDAAPLSLIRPLLSFSRAQCQKICAAAGFAWREDESNRDRSRRRARLRSDVLPVVESLWPGASKRAAHTASLLRDARHVVALAVAQVFGSKEQTTWPRDQLAGQPQLVIVEGLRRVLAAMMPADSLSQRSLRVVQSAARAIRDSSRRPRVFRVSSTIAVHVRANVVVIEHVPNPSATGLKQVSSHD